MNGRRTLTEDKPCFNVDPQWFMNMQSKYDLHVEAERLKAELAAIEPRSAA